MVVASTLADARVQAGMHYKDQCTAAKAVGLTPPPSQREQ
jgi:hypothetical protein